MANLNDDIDLDLPPSQVTPEDRRMIREYLAAHRDENFARRAEEMRQWVLTRWGRKSGSKASSEAADSPSR